MNKFYSACRMLKVKILSKGPPLAQGLLFHFNNIKKTIAGSASRWHRVFPHHKQKNTIAGSVGRYKASPLPLSVCLQTTY